MYTWKERTCKPWEDVKMSEREPAEDSFDSRTGKPMLDLSSRNSAGIASILTVFPAGGVFDVFQFKVGKPPSHAK
jgi:hypothetical protein